ncbi:unnamed protein product, partial [Closterium sp. NIES-64]
SFAMALKHSDEIEWQLSVPMAKSIVRGMDALQLASREIFPHLPRVVGIVAYGFDLLDFGRNFQHLHDSLGAWAGGMGGTDGGISDSKCGRGGTKGGSGGTRGGIVTLGWLTAGGHGPHTTTGSALTMPKAAPPIRSPVAAILPPAATPPSARRRVRPPRRRGTTSSGDADDLRPPRTAVRDSPTTSALPRTASAGLADGRAMTRRPARPRRRPCAALPTTRARADGQRGPAATPRADADGQRGPADDPRADADGQRGPADDPRADADGQRGPADDPRADADGQRGPADDSAR